MNSAKHYSKNDLQLKSDVPGAKMWAVALEKAMLTYFTVDSNCSFELHSHESEQITLVLEGELYFNFEDKEDVCVKAGEVIAIPSNLMHGAYTKDISVKAVDAWSPVRDEYKSKS